MHKVVQKLQARGVKLCSDVTDWIESHPDLDPQELWDICPRVDWMFHLMDELDLSFPWKEFKYEFAANHLRHIEDTDIRMACCDILEVVSRYIDGDADVTELTRARAEATDLASMTALDAVWAVAFAVGRSYDEVLYGSWAQALANNADTFRAFVPKAPEIERT